jgi:hypothetical protein
MAKTLFFLVMGSTAVFLIISDTCTSVSLLVEGQT